jgi:hypothetical protein
MVVPSTIAPRIPMKSGIHTLVCPADELIEYPGRHLLYRSHANCLEALVKEDDRAMPKVGEASFLGSSRALYSFNVYTMDSDFRDDISAVYVFSSTNEKGQYQPVLVGETSQLGNHVRGQKSSPQLKENGAKFICVQLDKDENNRKSTATDLISYYTPPCNGAS